MEVLTLGGTPPLNDVNSVAIPLTAPGETLCDNPPPDLYWTVIVVPIGEIPRLLVLKRLLGSIENLETVFFP